MKNGGAGPENQSPGRATCSDGLGGGHGGIASILSVYRDRVGWSPGRADVPLYDSQLRRPHGIERSASNILVIE